MSILKKGLLEDLLLARYVAAFMCTERGLGED